MSDSLTPIITQQGLEAIFNVKSSGFDATIAEIALGDKAWTPNKQAKGLKSEQRRIPVSGERVNDTQIHITGVEDGETTDYWVREVGVYLADGTLFAIWSDAKQPLAYKTKGVDLLLAFDLALTSAAADSVTVIDQGARLNLLLAAELARMATGEIDNMTRYLKQKFRLMNVDVLTQ